MKIRHAEEARARKMDGKYDVQSKRRRKRRIVTRLNEKRVRAWLVYDLFTLDMGTCKRISVQRRTRPLASVSTRSLAVALADTQTMNTEAP